MSLAGVADRVRTDRVLRGSVYLLVTTVATSALGYVFWVVAAHRFTPYEVGLAAVSTSAMSLAATVSNLGVHSALLQALAVEKDRQRWSRTVTAGLGVGGSAGLVAGLAALMLLLISGGAARSIAVSPLFAVALVAGVATTNMSMALDYIWLAQAKTGYMLLWNVVFSASKIALLFVAPLTVLGGAGVQIAWTLGVIVALIGALGLLTRVGVGYRIVADHLRAELRRLRPLLAGHHSINLGNMAATFLIPIIVAVRLSATDAAYFYAAWRVGGFFFVVASSMSSALFADGAGDPTGLAKRARNSAALVLAVLLPAMVVLFVAGGSIMELFGTNYRTHALSVLLILATTALPDVITNIYQSVLRVERRFLMGSTLAWSMAVLKLGGAWILLGPLGIAGAAWAFLGAQLVGSLAVIVDLVHKRRSRLRTGGGPSTVGSSVAAPELWPPD